MNGERGQSAIEALVVVPLCMVCALALIDAGVLLRDAMVLRRAASAAGVATVRGDDPARAARDALPARLRPSLRLTTSGPRIELSVAPRLTVLDRAGASRLRATAVTSVDGGAA